MSVRRRELLASFGVASASTLLWAFGCGAPTSSVRRAPQVSDQVRVWLRDAVARLAVIYPTVHALAVSRRRTLTARDVLGAGMAHERSDGVLFTVRDHTGARREHVTSSLTAASVAAAATALGATRARKPIDFGPAPAPPSAPLALDDRDLARRVERLLHADDALASRIVYAAATLDHDDATLWSVAPGRDLEQRLVRIRQTATRAAWNGTRPVVRTLERAWSGALDDHTLTDAEITATSQAVLEQTTPGTFDDGPRPVVLDPSVVARLIDAVALHLLTPRVDLAGAVASRATASIARPLPPISSPPAGVAPLATHLPGAVASPLLHLVDDPTVPGAYGSFTFDDQGRAAAPITLIDAGRITARDAADRGRRPGHLGRLQPATTHLVVSPGHHATTELYSDGFLLEGGIDAVLDARGDHIRITCDRARELRAGSPTGRVYADVELVGPLVALLTAIDAIARTPMTFSLPTVSLASRWASIATPALRTHGFVRARRSLA